MVATAGVFQASVLIELGASAALLQLSVALQGTVFPSDRTIAAQRVVSASTPVAASLTSCRVDLAKRAKLQ